MSAGAVPVPAEKGRIFNLQRYSLQDGPGLRTTVFLKGCPLACAWCHNPESQSPAPKLITQESRCIACGTCLDALRPGELPEDRPEQCVDLCPTGARQLLGREVTVDELMEELLRDRLFFDQSGGGVTLSGGEPLMQPGFVLSTLEALRQRGVHTALDTCGLGRREDLLAAAALADVVLFDLKHMDDAQHRHWTGAGNAAILANLEALSQVHGGIWIRVPVIPGVNDDLANLEATARFVAGLPGVRRLDLLPYHSTGAAKFRRLGMDYTLEQVEPPTPERMAGLAALFQAHGITATLGGNP
ncbi:glycyl-radical enzyme activating protein [Geothrix sp. PMB-07]|uniref:glycyl-radical enzyme activating protein n=1 Tax=Geothrix sp. PMB-07 TaxID=3068640 RepID=UPI002740C065|nr:glycyl-radical enzyme activating protein [Geothrix sp. PMB-07]WLT32582.1 glycyl-radical enzyme activating protein [Geothrix sp. PMB-07]